MREYVVRVGDSPASISAQAHHAGCPKCTNLLVAANPDLPTVTYPNGFKTFRELRVGQRLRLPDAWFDGTLDRQPQSYFDSLPYADGVTPSKVAGVGKSPVEVIGSAKAAVAAIAADPNYCTSVSQAGSPVNQAVHDFKAAWNADNPNFTVPIGTSNYELSTANALSLALGKKPSPPGCVAGSPSGPMQPLSAPVPKGLSTGAIVGIGLLAAVTVGGITFAATYKPRRQGSPWDRGSNSVRRHR